jgi:hypothetical protein
MFNQIAAPMATRCYRVFGTAQSRCERMGQELGQTEHKMRWPTSAGAIHDLRFMRAREEVLTLAQFVITSTTADAKPEC